MNSIRRQVTWLLIALIVLITFSAAIAGYRASMTDATRLFDGELQAIAHTLSALPATPQQDSKRIIPSPPDVAWQLWQQGNLQMRSVNAPDSPISAQASGFSSENFLGNRWRVLVVESPDREKTVMVAHPLSSRDSLAENLILAAMTPVIVTIPLLAILIYWVVNRGVRPLISLSEQLRSKARNNLEPIALNTTPVELSSVIQTLNSLFDRLNKAFEREQLFSANAAHELRTPLSVLKINLHNLQEAELPSKAAIATCQQDTDRMIRVINQLLLLSRTNPESNEVKPEHFDIESTVQGIISELYSAIDAKQQSISLDSQPCNVYANAFAIQTLITNLIANASKYTPERGNIEVEIKQTADWVILRIADSGPGIPSADYDNVLSPFFRVTNAHTQQQSGSGIGLAIVNQVVALHRGDVSLGASSLGGLLVTVRLPIIRHHEVSKKPIQQATS